MALNQSMGRLDPHIDRMGIREESEEGFKWPAASEGASQSGEGSNRRSFTSFTTSIDTDRIGGVPPCYIGLDQVHTPRPTRTHRTQMTSPKSPRPMSRMIES